MSALKVIHQMFWGNSLYIFIYMASCIYTLYIWKKSSIVQRKLIVYNFLILFGVVYNPVILWLAHRYIVADVGALVRVYLILPIYAIMAWSMCEIVVGLKKVYKKYLVAIAFLIIIVFVGTSYIDVGMQIRADNIYKLEQESLDIANMILDNSNGEVNILIDTDGVEIQEEWAKRNNNLVEGIRQYTSEIKILDSFDGNIIYNESGIGALYEYIKQLKKSDSPFFDYIIMKNNDKVKKILTSYGFQDIGSTSNYTILKNFDNLQSDVISNVATKTVVIDGLKETQKIVVVNDMHIICPYDGISDKNIDMLTERYNTFSIGPNGMPSSTNWNQFAEEINVYEPDLVVFAGDMIDYMSEANMECLEAGMQKIDAPILYIRADHDYGVFWSDTLTSEDAKTMQGHVDDNPEVWNVDMGEYLVVGIDGSTWELTDSALNSLKKIFSLDKPIILVTHVPIDSSIKSELREISIEMRERPLVWGENDYYVPGENMSELLQMLYKDDSPVKAVIAAHLHLAYDVQLSETVEEYVFGPSFAGNIGIINVVASEE